VFETRSPKLERIDTGDYTAAEYERFLIDIRLVNRFAGDRRALKKTLLSEIKSENVKSFSVLDVGAGSGELLREIARFARRKKADARLFGLELSYDYVISSLFTHHLTDELVVEVLKEMKRVARRKIFVIDLNRHPLAYLAYKIFCAAFRISPLVREDGSLSILRSFKPSELKALAVRAGLENARVRFFSPRKTRDLAQKLARTGADVQNGKTLYVFAFDLA
jgi:2-polyprenyl-3-methyl-5-hydroxy-6-metoxy-1,4-benzoquinol methylase